MKLEKYLTLNKYEQVDHLFRHEYGQLVALLVRRMGIQYIDKIEDSVQWAMAQALEFWRMNEIPKSPSAWLYRVAYRYLLSELKITQQRTFLLKEHSELENNNAFFHEEEAFSSELSDSMLRMLFVTCHCEMPIESQLVFTLKSLCGFNVREIALRLFITEANVYKRFSRAKSFLQNQSLALDDFVDSDVIARLPSVHRVLYLVFTEGYLSSHADMAIRRDLCEEAIRLTKLLAASHFGKVTNTFALLALMYFHLARINARQDSFGALLLLAQQDRSQWDKEHINLALYFLNKSAKGECISRYHIEAGIAAAHCIAPSFKQTKWGEVVASYKLLHRISPSPLHILNEAIATAEWKSPQEGLVVLHSVEKPHWLANSYYWYTVKADLLLRSGEITKSHKYSMLAIKLAPSKSIKKLLTKRLIPN